MVFTITRIFSSALEHEPTWLELGNFPSDSPKHVGFSLALNACIYMWSLKGILNSYSNTELTPFWLETEILFLSNVEKISIITTTKGLTCVRTFL